MTHREGSVAALTQRSLISGVAKWLASRLAAVKVVVGAVVAFAVMLMPEEFSRDELAIKDLATGKQIEVPREQVVGWLREHREFDR